jgi:hypothetical protein
MTYSNDSPPLRPEFIRKARLIMRQKAINVGTIKDFNDRYGLYDKAK